MAITNIICYGCSHTRGHYGKNGKSWPHILSEKIDNRNFVVFDRSVMCNSIHNQFVQVMSDLKFKTPSTIIILQWTTFTRITFSKKSKHRYTLSESTEKVSSNYVRTVNDFSPGKFSKSDKCMHLNAGILNEHQKRLPSVYRIAYERLLAESVGPYGYHNEYFGVATKHYMKHILDRASVKNVRFDHINPLTVPDLFIASEDNRNSVDFIVSEDLNNFSKYVIDNGFHFGNEGNEALVDELILPHLRQKGIDV